MRTAKRFPELERSCRLRVAGLYQDHSCDVVENHQGPCAALAIPASVEAREAWESAHPEKVDVPVEEPWVI